MKQVLARITFMWALMFLVFNAYADADADCIPGDAQVLIEKTTNKVLTALKADSSKIYTLVDEVVLPHFDFVKMSQLVLAQNWHKIFEDEKRRFVEEFRGLLVRTYSTALVEAAKTDVDVSYEKPVETKKNRITLKTKVKQSGKEPINADYFMYCNKEAKWKVYNIKVGGVSLVTNYREEFKNDIKNIGIEGLIDKIKNQNRDNQQPKSE